jgi:3-phenylpropionate/trans-cinnamate dioxygenase ferredoxin subunit
MAWKAIADLDQLEEGDMMLVQLGQPVCVVRLQEDEVVAVHNTCTHQQQPLNEGYLQDDDTLICPAHNSRFDLHTGEPIGIPAVIPSRLRLQDRGWRDLGRHGAAAQRRGDPAQAAPLSARAGPARAAVRAGPPCGRTPSC